MNYLKIYEEILALTDDPKAAAEAISAAFDFEEKRKADEDANEMLAEDPGNVQTTDHPLSK